MPENMDAMVEATRVFGNFSRTKEVRTLLAEQKGKSWHLILLKYDTDFLTFLSTLIVEVLQIPPEVTLFTTFDYLVDEIMIALLDAGERETVFTACGVLINLMIDENIKPKLKEEDGIKK